MGLCRWSRRLVADCRAPVYRCAGPSIECRNLYLPLYLSHAARPPLTIAIAIALALAIAACATVCPTKPNWFQ